MKKPSVIITVIIVTIIVLSVLQVTVANSISTTGIELEKIQQEITMYQKQNTALHEQLLQASSLTTISEEAKNLGFVETNSQMVLSEPLPLALNQ